MQQVAQGPKGMSHLKDQKGFQTAYTYLTNARSIFELILQSIESCIIVLEVCAVQITAAASGWALHASSFCSE